MADEPKVEVKVNPESTFSMADAQKLVTEDNNLILPETLKGIQGEPEKEVKPETEETSTSETKEPEKVVPYERLKEVIDQKNLYKDQYEKITKDVELLKSQVNKAQEKVDSPKSKYDFNYKEDAEEAFNNLVNKLENTEKKLQQIEEKQHQTYAQQFYDKLDNAISINCKIDILKPHLKALIEQKMSIDHKLNIPWDEKRYLNLAKEESEKLTKNLYLGDDAHKKAADVIKKNKESIQNYPPPGTQGTIAPPKVHTKEEAHKAFLEGLKGLSK